MKTKLLRFVGIILLVCTASVMTAQWTVYDMSNLPENDDLYWEKRRTTTGITDGPTSVLTHVEEDAEIPGNWLIRSEDLKGGLREGWMHPWNITDPVKGVTWVGRAKPTDSIPIVAPTAGEPEKVNYFFIHLVTGVRRAQLQFFYGDRLVLTSLSGNDVEMTFSDMDWVIYRITIADSVVNVYLNEDPTPVLIGYGGANTNNFVWWGDYANDPSGTMWDWMAWDTTGAYAPGEGNKLPSELTGLPEEPEPDWVVYDMSVLPENHDLLWEKRRTTTGITDGPTSVLTHLEEDAEIPGNWLIRSEDLQGGLREGWKHDWNTTPITNLTWVGRAKPTDSIPIVAPTAGEPAKVTYLFIHLATGSRRTELMYYYGDRLVLGRLTPENKEINFNNMDWNIYRITLADSVVNVYVNEDPTPVLSGIAGTVSDNFVWWGDFANDASGTIWDWMTWHLGGAWAPGEGPALPSGLTGLPETSVKDKISGKAEQLLVYPNPFASSTRIRYTVEQQAVTTLDILDISGRQMMNLVNQQLMPGTYEAYFDADDLPAGIYLCTFRSGSRIIVNKLLKQ